MDVSPGLRARNQGKGNTDSPPVEVRPLGLGHVNVIQSLFEKKINLRFFLGGGGQIFLIPLPLVIKMFTGHHNPKHLPPFPPYAFDKIK